MGQQYVPSDYVATVDGERVIIEREGESAKHFFSLTLHLLLPVCRSSQDFKHSH